jgi:myo-inositol-1(or 4)-monophosphatase
MSLKSEVEARLAEAEPIVAAAGEVALRHFRTPITVENKLGGRAFDPVTEADRRVERLIRERLGALYPESPIMGEEEGFTPGTGAWSWIIDPIDGTRAFITGVPAWGVLLGLLHDGLPVGGIMHQPYLGETFVGGPGGAVLRRGGEERRLRASGRTALAEAVLYSTHPAMFAGQELGPGFEAVSRAVRMTRFGGDCYSYCLLALGSIDLVIESGLQPYDILPLMPIVEAAGGVVTGPDGEPPLAGGTVVAAASAALHARALEKMLSGSAE